MNGNDILADRVGAVTRSIASGNNACGTLMGRDGRLNLDFIVAAVRPTLEVYESEADDLRADRARVSRESEDRRQCLEFIYANASGHLPREVGDRLREVLGYAGR